MIGDSGYGLVVTGSEGVGDILLQQQVYTCDPLHWQLHLSLASGVGWAVRDPGVGRVGGDTPRKRRL